MAKTYSFLPDFSVFEDDEQDTTFKEATNSSIMSRNRKTDTSISDTGEAFLKTFYQNLRKSFESDEKFKETFLSKDRPKPDISELRSYVDKVKGSSGIEDALLEATGMYNPGTPSDDNSMTIKDASDGITVPKQPDVMVDELSSGLGSYLRNRDNKGSSFVGEGVQMASAGSLSVEDMDLARMMAGQTMRKEAAEMGLPVVDMEEEAKKSAVEAARERAKKGITQSKGAPQGIMSPKAVAEEEVETAEDTTPVVEDKGSAREDAIAAGPEETVAPQIVFLNDSTTNKGSTERGIYQYAYEQGIKGDELQSFMSQVAHESSKFGKMQESGYLWKNVASMEQVKKDRLARDGVTEKNATAERIFNSIYAGKNGNGDFASGDGSRYKGRGYIQLTGRDNYRLIGEDIGEDLEGKPNLMLDPEIAKRASVAWWKRNVRSKKPDYTDVKRVTRIVNGGEKGLSERKNYFKRYGEKPAAPKVSLRPSARPDTRVASN